MKRTWIRLVAASSVAVLCCAVAAIAAEHHAHWTYEGNSGPEAWAKLDQEFATCGIGKTQSPIDIRDEDAKPADLPAIQFNYKPGASRSSTTATRSR